MAGAELARVCWLFLGWQLLVAPLGFAAEPTRRQGMIAAGTRWETIYRVIDSGEPGPAVLIVGGVHGDEPAGAAAADQISHWSVARGRLVVIPSANRRALDAKTRNTPDVPAAEANLNRNFPKSAGPNHTSGELAKEIWEFVVAQHPDWLLDLHEGYDFTQANGDSVGSSIIHSRSVESADATGQMLETVNATIEDPLKRFVPKGPPIDSSLARAASESLNIPTMIVETTSKSQPLSLRVRQHRWMVHRFLSRLSMIEGSPDVLVEEQAAKAWLPARDPIFIALYDGPGSTTSPGPQTLEQRFASLPHVIARRVGPADIKAGALVKFHVVVMPGGSGSRQGEALGTDGREQVRSFVRGGGGYIGHCAGSYLATSKYSWGLGILDAQTVDREHWQRGTGTVDIELTESGREILGDKAGRFGIRYANGPLLAPANDDSIPDFTPLAHYRGEIAKNGAPSGVMIDTPAVVAGTFGEGRVLCFSPHPEYTEGLDSFVHRAVLWAGQRAAEVGTR